LVKITVKIPNALNKRLEAEASWQGIPKSAMIRRALEQLLNESGPSRRHTAFEGVKDLCGIIKGGPTDVSTNPKYLTDFGR
jgi:hypothetical protein